MRANNGNILVFIASLLSFFQLFGNYCAQRHALQLRREAQRSERSGRLKAHVSQRPISFHEQSHQAT